MALTSSDVMDKDKLLAACVLAKGCLDSNANCKLVLCSGGLPALVHTLKTPYVMPLPPAAPVMLFVRSSSIVCAVRCTVEQSKEARLQVYEAAEA